jgi:hypothetical protein
MSDEKYKLTGYIPDYLPKRLTIASWLWNWLTHTSEADEPFYDLEKCFRELVERGFNSIRIDALPGWIYDSNGNKRGPVQIGNVAEPGFVTNCPNFDFKGGKYVDVLEELLRLFGLAEKYDIYVILTSWQHQAGHSTTLLADTSLKHEINSIAPESRLRNLALHYERLIEELRKHHFEKRLAFVEIHNEINLIQLGDSIQKTKALLEESLAYLQKRYPSILFSGDYTMDYSGDFDFNKSNLFINQLPSNTQVMDIHLYAPRIWQDLLKEAGIIDSIPQSDTTDESLAGLFNNLEKTNPFFTWLLRPDKLSWSEFSSHFTAESRWRKVIYMFENLNANHYDYWMFANFHKYEGEMKNFWKNNIQLFGYYGQKKNLPVVCDEGYILYPPTNSYFEVSPVGKHIFEFIVDEMISANYWGIMISTYTSPGQPLWEHEVGWVKEINNKIVNSYVK